jgi:signal transduction histidine kinase
MKGQAYRFALFYVLLSLFFLQGFGQDMPNMAAIDSMKHIQHQQKGSDRIKTLYRLSGELVYSDLNEALDIGRLALEEALAQHDSLWAAFVLVDLSYIHRYRNEYQIAFNYLNRARLIAEEKNYPVALINAYTGYGSLYAALNIYDKALQYHHDALKIKEDINDIEGLPVTYNNIGVIFYKIDDIEKALSYYFKALDLKIDNKDSLSLVTTLNNIGFALNESGNFEKALVYFTRSINISNQYFDPRHVGLAYNGVANIYIQQGKLDAAESILERAVANAEETKNLNLLSYNYYLFAKLYEARSAYDQSIAYLKKSQELVRVTKDRQREKNNLKLLAEIYEEKNEYDSAYYYQKEYSVIEDSIFNERLAKNLANIQIALTEEQNMRVIEAQEQRITKNKQINVFLIFILILSLALIIVVTRNYFITNKKNKLLKESKNEIEAQKESLENKNKALAKAQKIIHDQNVLLKNINSELEEKVKERTLELELSNTHLEKAVHDLDQFIYKTSHDLRGPIATMQGIINLGSMEQLNERTTYYFETLYRVSSNLNNVLSRLIEVHETYQKALMLEHIDPAIEIFETATRIARFTECSEKINIKTDLKSNGRWRSDRVLFNSIIENMLRNAILYSDKDDAFVEIHTEYADGRLRIVFEDNGFGIQPGLEEKVFNIFFKGSPKPGGTGLEIYTTKIAVEKLGGTIALIKSTRNTMFEISLPPLS